MKPQIGHVAYDRSCHQTGIVVGLRTAASGAKIVTMQGAPGTPHVEALARDVQTFGYPDAPYSKGRGFAALAIFVGSVVGFWLLVINHNWATEATWSVGLLAWLALHNAVTGAVFGSQNRRHSAARRAAAGTRK